MKHKYKYAIKTVVTIIAISVVLIRQNANAQPGYRYPSGTPNPGYRSAQNYRQRYNPYNQRDYFQPFVNFSLHLDPLISWFSTDSYDTHSDGVVRGYNFGILHNSYFGPNYSFYSGINIIKAGGKLINWETTRFELKNYRSILTIEPGESISYRLTYLSVPLGLELQSNKIGYGRFFADLGFAPEIIISSRADIPSLKIYGGNASPELNILNVSFHVMAGMKYPLAGNNNFIFGIGFSNSLFDITRDNGDQPMNIVTQKMLSFRLGMTF